MKSTGIVRKVDNLGRIVLPVELRRTLGIDIHSDVEIYVDGDQVILKKYLPCCFSAAPRKSWLPMTTSMSAAAAAPSWASCNSQTTKDKRSPCRMAGAFFFVAARRRGGAFFAKV